MKAQELTDIANTMVADACRRAPVDGLGLRPRYGLHPLISY